MDTLTFNAPILYRHLTFSEAKKQPISEINLQKALEGLEMNMSQACSIFLMQCDFSSNVPILVHRPLHTTRLWLSWTHQGYRPQISTEACPWIRRPRTDSWASSWKVCLPLSVVSLQLLLKDINQGRCKRRDVGRWQEEKRWCSGSGWMALGSCKETVRETWRDACGWARGLSSYLVPKDL